MDKKLDDTISDLIWLLGSNLLDDGSEQTVRDAIEYLEELQEIKSVNETKC